VLALLLPLEELLDAVDFDVLLLLDDVFLESLVFVTEPPDPTE